MEEQEIKTLFEDMAKKNGEAISQAVKKEIADATKGLLTADQLATKLEALGLKDGAINELTSAVEKQGMELQKMIEGKNQNTKKDIGELVIEKGEAIKMLANQGNGDASKNVKLRVSANKTIVERASVTNNTMGYRAPGIGQLATRNLVMDQVFPTVNMSEQDVRDSNGVIRYLDVTSETRNAAETAEKLQKPESAIAWQEYTQALQTIADTIPVTKQAYRNLSFVAGEIERLLRRNHALRKDLQLYSGDGVAPNIRGVYTAASAPTLANLPAYQNVEDANLYDLLASLRVYVSNGSAGTGKQSKYAPNIALMNPADVLKYKLAKATDGHYILPPFVSADGMRVDQLVVVETPVVTANTLVVGDFNYGTIYQEEDLTIEMGWVNDQFIKNQWTIRAEQVLCLLIRNADLDAFVKITDIDAAVAALLKP